MKVKHQAIILEFTNDMEPEMMEEALNKIQAELFEKYHYCSISNTINESRIPELDKITKNIEIWDKWNAMSKNNKEISNEKIN
ncbi:hypothetical protein SAC12B_0017 [Lactobacillus phage SAC12B]|uniref:Uncharacterized protein n=1 Tax=Lactobacillus phage SAC12B TaxID=2510941 RepID=A0A4Y5FFE2_9CAUD|nr:hypothetical protein HWC10_gp017 [Lactobacillus phage SAC12B]QBJ03806.1 hypothetical protein SAC12B_0017 [Lactobacillus phage SAC12B]